ncbi:MAG: S1 family peptidase [Aridibacter sp.]
MVPSEILQRVFFIKYRGNTGTCFLVSIESKDFLITSKHLFPTTISNETEVEIEIYRTDGWIKFQPDYLIHPNLDIDIAVLCLKSNDQKDNLFDIGSQSYFLSQECFFLGFPFGLKMDDNEAKMNNGFPIPFVKKAIISSFITDADNMTQIFLDGHNNPGFSGGPVVIANYEAGSKYKMRIVGVVSAYLTDEKIIKTPLGDFKNSENSGIVLSYAFDHVIEIVKTK